MNVFVTGASGYIGSAVTEKLQHAGHSVSALARSDESARKLMERGAATVRGDLRNREALESGARDSDATIHLAIEFSGDAPRLDRTAIDAILTGIGSSGKPFVYTSGIWVMGSTGSKTVDETTPVNPTPLIAWRPLHEQLVLHAPGARGVVIRPAMVYGRGGGAAGDFARSAKRDGVVRYIGDGENRWPFVHVDDLAALYVLALGAPAGSLYFAAAGPSYKVREVAERAAAGAKVESIPLDEARKTMGPLADALTLDQVVSARKAEHELGWKPTHLSVLENGL